MRVAARASVFSLHVQIGGELLLVVVAAGRGC